MFHASWMTLLLAGLTGTVLAQPPPLTVPDMTPNRNDWSRPAGTLPNLAIPERRTKFEGRSHLEVRLGRSNALVLGFNDYTQLRTHQNVDSVLRLFVADYARIKDSTAVSTAGLHLTYRLGPTDRVIDQQSTPPAAVSFRFGAGEQPTLLKLRQDTLRVVWEKPGQRTAYHPVAVYLLINSLDDVPQLLAEGGVNARLQTAIENVQQYQRYDLTNPRYTFNLVQTNQREYRFVSAGLVRNPFISVQPSIGVGLIRHQFVPSLQLNAEYIPSRFHTVGYAVGYLSTFFFPNPADGQGAVLRNDFLNIGLTFYRSSSNEPAGNFNRIIAGFYVGIPVYRSGGVFASNAIRLSSTVYHRGPFKIQPEIYMNGFFRQVYPGVRLGIGL